MMRTSLNGIRFSVTPGLYFFLALLILLVPLRWLVGVVISVGVHELCHILAIRSFGVPIYSVQIGANGAKIQAKDMPLWQELVCTLAGPMGGIVLLLLARWLPVTALCAGFHTLYNLLPVYPQDGGRALRCGTRLLLPERFAKLICGVAEYVCLAGVGILGIYGTFLLKVGIFPLIFSLLYLCRNIGMKISLQRGELRGTI